MDQGVGHEIKRLREERGWSQARLAVEAEMSVSGVSMIESGQRNLTTTTLAKLARAFELEIADLFPKAPAPQQLELEEPRGADEELRAKDAVLEAWQEYLDLELKRSEELRKEIISIVDLEDDLQVERIFARGIEFCKNVERITKIAESRFIPVRAGGSLSLEEAYRLRVRAKKLLQLGDAFMTFINHVNEVADELEIKRATEEMIQELREELDIPEVDAATKDV